MSLCNLITSFLYIAPPSLLDVVYCEEESCTYSDINATSYEEFRVTVKWNGIGPFSVQWKHNDSDFYCNNSHCGEEKSTNSMVNWMYHI